jgi:TBC1 domain family member 20
VIVPTLRRYPKLCYFQGFHDIAQVLLLVLGKEEASRAVAFLSLVRIRDFMLPSLSPSLVHLKLLPAIIFAADPALHQHLRGVRPFFALAATLTLYAHEVEDYGQIARLYDFLLAHEAAVSLYLFAVIILSRKDQLLEIPAEDSDILNFILSKLPKPLDLERLITDTMELFMKHPPKDLPFHAWRQIPASSVLRTTQVSPSSSSPGIARTDLGLSEGESLFSKQLIDLERQEKRERILKQLWTYRRPVVGVAAAVLVGVLSVWIQRNGLYFSPRLLSRLRGILTSFGRQ